MYAIIKISGRQVKVEKDQKIFVNRLEQKEGEKVELDEVLLIQNSGKAVVGSPKIDGARVTAKVIAHLKDEKVIVFKKKRRKGYKVKNGHRQYLTELLIEKIEEKAAKKAKKTETKTEEKAAKAEKPAATAEKKATKPKSTATKASPKAAAEKPKTEAKPKAKAEKQPAASKEKKAAPKKSAGKDSAKGESPKENKTEKE